MSSGNMSLKASWQKDFQAVHLGASVYVKKTSTVRQDILAQRELSSKKLECALKSKRKNHPQIHNALADQAKAFL